MNIYKIKSFQSGSKYENNPVKKFPNPHDKNTIPVAISFILGPILISLKICFNRKIIFFNTELFGKNYKML